MGKVEKIVVLSVAFLIVVILAISTQGGASDDVQAANGSPIVGEEPGLEAPPNGAAEAGGGSGPAKAPNGVPNDGEPGAGSSGPADSGERTLGEVLQPPTADPARKIPDGLEGTDRDSVAGVRGGPGSAEPIPTEPVYEVPTEIPGNWDLVTLAGLADHLFDPTLKVYTARRGDTLREVARRYYGDEAYVVALERNNEGLEKLNPGHQMLLPVRAREIVAEPADQYVVQDGESLWKIAKKVYGAGHRWGEIYEANRGVLNSPDAVTPGTALRIP